MIYLVTIILIVIILVGALVFYKLINPRNPLKENMKGNEVVSQEDLEFDNEGYQKSLDKLVTMAEKEYYVHLVDINRHQVIVSRILLWLLVVALGFNFAFIDWVSSKIPDNAEYFSTRVSTYLFILLSIVTGCCAFAFSLFSIPAFGGYGKVYKESWAEFAEPAYENWEKGEEIVYENTLNSILINLDQACYKGAETNYKRGIKLRVSTILTIASYVMSIIAFIIFSFNFYL